MRQFNPLTVASDRRSWTDSNGDGLAQPNELGPSTGFRGGTNLRFDPNLTRPYNWEYVATIQQEILPQFSASAAYYRRSLRNNIGRRNVAVTANQYSPVSIANPLTGQPLTVYNQSLATRSLVGLVVMNAADLNAKYDGLEMKIDKRFTKGAFLSGGMTIGRNLGFGGSDSSDLNNPNFLVNSRGIVNSNSTYQTKITGAYPLPWKLQFASVLQALAGLPLRRTYTVTRTDVPSLTQVSQNIELMPRGKVRTGRFDIWDIRVARRFQSEGWKLDVMADLFNLLNTNTPVSEVEAVGPSLGRPSQILDGRLLRLGIQFSF